MTGTYNSTGHAVTVGLGYKGTITLNNVNITTTTDASSCIYLDGGTGNLPTQTDVNLYLIGINNLWGSKNVGVGYWESASKCSIHIRAGAKLTIDGTGSLDVKIGQNSLTKDINAASAIGAGFTDPEWIAMGQSAVMQYAGGDLIIKGGTITATGSYHSSGIGNSLNGGLRSIVIVGGRVTSLGGAHGAGIGGACRPSGVGSVVALPPASVSAKAGSAIREDVGSLPSTLYLGDPAQKKLSVSANPNNRKDVNVLFDVSGDTAISSALTLAGLNPARWFAGTTGSTGIWQTTGKIAGNVKIYSDTPTLSGYVYSSKRVSVPGTADVHVTLEEPDMSNPFILVTQNVTAWTNGSVTLTAKFNPSVPNLVRIREQGGTWQSISLITKTVSSNGTHYFEAENEDGNTMTISHTVTNIDKAEPTLNVS